MWSPLPEGSPEPLFNLQELEELVAKTLSFETTLHFLIKVR